MSESDKLVDLTPSTYDSPVADCPITTVFQVKDPTTQEWTTVTNVNSLTEYPFVANVASSSLTTIFTEPEQLEHEFMQKYISGDNMVINAQWKHCETTWVEDDSDCVTDEFTITFSFELGDVCAKNIIELATMTKEQFYPIMTDGTSLGLKEVARGTISAAYSRCSLATTVQVLDVLTDEWIDYE
jgi:hypothetical protein